MNNIKEDPSKKKKDADKDDATKPFANSQKASASEVHKAGDDESRNYKRRETSEARGPNWDKVSRNEDGDTGVNSNIYK